jgi:hypothetical protein
LISIENIDLIQSRGDENDKRAYSGCVMHLSEHNCEQVPALVILTMNTFQRFLTDSDPLLRARALMGVSSIFQEEVLPAVIAAMNQPVGDLDRLRT